MKRLRRNPVSSLGKNRPAKTSGAISVPFLFAVALKESSLPPFLPSPPLPPFYIKNELSPPTTNGVRAFDRVVAPLLFDKSRDDLSSPLLRSSEFLMHYFPSSTLGRHRGEMAGSTRAVDSTTGMMILDGCRVPVSWNISKGRIFLAPPPSRLISTGNDLKIDTTTRIRRARILPSLPFSVDFKIDSLARGFDAVKDYPIIRSRFGMENRLDSRFWFWMKDAVKEHLITEVFQVYL